MRANPDVRMPGLDSFGVLKAANKHPHVVFATAFDTYALQAVPVEEIDG